MIGGDFHCSKDELAFGTKILLFESSVCLHVYTTICILITSTQYAALFLSKIFFVIFFLFI